MSPAWQPDLRTSFGRHSFLTWQVQAHEGGLFVVFVLRPADCVRNMAPQADKPAQANLELLGLVSHPEASADDCIEALSAASKAPSCSALKEAAKLVMEQWTKKDPGMAVRVLEVVMPSMAYMVSSELQKPPACCVHQD